MRLHTSRALFPRGIKCSLLCATHVINEGKRNCVGGCPRLHYSKFRIHPIGLPRLTELHKWKRNNCFKFGISTLRMPLRRQTCLPISESTRAMEVESLDKRRWLLGEPAQLRFLRHRQLRRFKPKPPNIGRCSGASSVGLRFQMETGQLTGQFRGYRELQEKPSALVSPSP